MTPTVACVGSDEETWAYIARRLKSVEVERFPRLEEFSPEREDVALVVLRLDGDLPEALQATARRLSERRIPFVVISGVETMKAAVQSMRLGAFDYFLASDDKDDVVDAVLRWLEPRRVHRADSEADASDGEEVMVGRSQKIQEVFKLIGKISSSNVSVLLRGESGTGKELVARLIHANSARRRFPFVVIDCSAIPRDLVENELFGHEAGAYSGAGGRGVGKFDLADQGTVFLDEVTGLDLDLQSKLLRVIQQGSFDRVGGTRPIQVDVRTIAATQSNLEELVREHRFRQDLYHRLNVITLSLPPLRERAEDIPLLVHHFVRKHGRALGLPDKQTSVDLMSRLERYHWPGNVRELENVVRRALLLERGPVLTTRFLDEFPVPGEGPVEEADLSIGRLVAERFLAEELNWKRPDVWRQLTSKVERVAIGRVLDLTKGNQVSAARILGISRNTLRVKMAGLGLQSADFR